MGGCLLFKPLVGSFLCLGASKDDCACLRFHWRRAHAPPSPVILGLLCLGPMAQQFGRVGLVRCPCSRSGTAASLAARASGADVGDRVCWFEKCNRRAAPTTRCVQLGWRGVGWGLGFREAGHFSHDLVEDRLKDGFSTGDLHDVSNDGRDLGQCSSNVPGELGFHLRR